MTMVILQKRATVVWSRTGIPLGWPKNGFPAPEGPYYGGIGTNISLGRNIVEAHCRACLYAGLEISGINSENMPAQWEFQIGPCEGIQAGDQVWVARFLLERICEEFGACVSFDPKPVLGNWSGAGCHVNYSTKEMREEGGYTVIEDFMNRLKKKHKEHIEVYGQGNEKRLTGHHETALIHKFTFEIGNRGCSIRVPRTTYQNRKGYFEDRRPASNMDPYIVSAKLVETTLILQNEI
jgi:glutamine synthetase